MVSNLTVSLYVHKMDGPPAEDFLGGRQSTPTEALQSQGRRRRPYRPQTPLTLAPSRDDHRVAVESYTMRSSSRLFGKSVQQLAVRCYRCPASDCPRRTVRNFRRRARPCPSGRNIRSKKPESESKPGSDRPSVPSCMNRGSPANLIHRGDESQAALGIEHAVALARHSTSQFWTRRWLIEGHTNLSFPGKPAVARRPGDWLTLFTKLSTGLSTGQLAFHISIPQLFIVLIFASLIHLRLTTPDLLRVSVSPSVRVRAKFPQIKAFRDHVT